jgi:lysine 2,3-aminomutase
MYPKDSSKYWYSGKGHWQHIPDEKWNDWRWQMKHRVKSIDGFSKYLNLTKDEIDGLRYADNRLSVAITPYFFNLIDPNDANCPIRKQVVPVGSESVFIPEEVWDPVGEENNMPVSTIVHRYPDRVLFLVTDRCASYCRYCTRSRLVSNAQGYGFHPQIDKGIDYIKNNSSVRDVLISGGDPLLLSDSKLSYVLSSLQKIDHVEFVRIGSRVPVFMPQRITPSLQKIFSDIPNLWISIHVNHPDECTLSLKSACHKLAKCGIPLGNQSVLLKGINDDLETMKSLVHRLLMMKVKPYYLYQCDLIKGSSHLRTNVSKGIEIIKGLRGHTSGYAVPQFVIDSPNGGGKIPVSPDYTTFEKDGSIKINDFNGNSYIYPNLDTGRPLNTILD